MNMEPTNLFAVLAHDTRLRCLMLLHSHGELCVCELTQAIGQVQPHISRHLALLREAGLVADRRDGLWIYYRLHPELPDWVREVLRATAEEARNLEPFSRDLLVLAEMPNRPGAPKCA